MIKIFENSEFGQVRTLEENGQVLFCGSDVAKALGYDQPHKAIERHCKEDGGTFHTVIDSMGREQKAKFIKLNEKYNIREIAYDRWNASMMVQNLQDDGFTMIPFGQGFKDMSPPSKELMRLVLEKKLCHGGHPILRWNMDNAYVRTDPAGNVKIDKEKSTEKVDGAVALVMALDRAMKNMNGGSVYDERGLLFI